LVWLVAGWLLLPMINIGIRALEFIDIGLSGSVGVFYKSVMWVLIFVSMIWLIGFMFEMIKRFGQTGDDLV